MKRNSIYFLLFSILLLACDKIEEDDRSSVVDNINAIRPVLLEDFTGQNCINCPRAAAKASNIQKALKEKLIIVSIHAGPFSLSRFRTEAGNAYQEKFYPANDSYPAAMIDRSQLENDIISTNDSKWGTYVFERAQLKDYSELSLELKAEYNNTNNEFTVHSTINGSTALEKVMLQLWVTENNIIAPQKSGNETILEYVHNHVLRDAINGIWGEEIDEKEIPNSSPFSTTYSLETKEWKTEDLNIVGFLYHPDTYEILYVTEISLINN